MRPLAAVKVAIEVGNAGLLALLLGACLGGAEGRDAPGPDRPTDAGERKRSGEGLRRFLDPSDASLVRDASSSQGDGGAADAGGRLNDAASPASCGDGQVDGEERCDPDADLCCNDTCDGARSAGTTCRPAADACDSPEHCDGSSTACPNDALQPAGVICRAAADACDVPEICDGEGASCPPPVAHCDLVDIGSLAGEPESGKVVPASTAGGCDLLQPSCAPGVTGGSPELTFRFTAARTGGYVLDTFGSSYDTVLAVVDELSCGATELACNDDVGAQRQSQVGLSLLDGQSVFIVVDGFDSSGEFSLRVAHAAADSCCSAGLLPGCRDALATQCVCERDFECCTEAWDELCVTAVKEVCGACQD